MNSRQKEIAATMLVEKAVNLGAWPDQARYKIGHGKQQIDIHHCPENAAFGVTMASFEISDFPPEQIFAHLPTHAIAFAAPGRFAKDGNRVIALIGGIGNPNREEAIREMTNRICELNECETKGCALRKRK